MLGKIIFHIIYSILIMVYLFIGIPYTTNSSFGNKISVVLFTILQMLYIILSSLQISHGYFLSLSFFLPLSYPTSDNYINNIINKSYSSFNRLLFYVSLFLSLNPSAIATFPSSSKSTKFSTGPSATRLSTSCFGSKSIPPMRFSTTPSAAFSTPFPSHPSGARL